MLFIKKQFILMVVVLVILLVFSSSTFAQEPAPHYIYFEVADGFPTTNKNVVMVNYDKILNPGDYGISDSDHQGLIDSLKLGVRSSLAAYQKVWIETEVGGETVVLLYSEALYDGKNYAEAVNDSTYYTSRPEVNFEMYYEGGRKFRVPDESEFKPLELPAWLEDYSAVYEEITDTWLLTVTIDEDELPEGGTLNKYTKLRYIYYEDDQKMRIYASPVPETDYKQWFFVIPEDEVNIGTELDLSPGDLEVRVGLTYYNY